MVLLNYSVNEIKYEVCKTEARYSCLWSGYVDQPAVSKHRVGWVYFIFGGLYARMVESADTKVSNTFAAKRVGSSPTSSTSHFVWEVVKMKPMTRRRVMPYHCFIMGMRILYNGANYCLVGDICGSSSMAEHWFSKPRAVGSSPIYRSNLRVWWNWKTRMV